MKLRVAAFFGILIVAAVAGSILGRATGPALPGARETPQGADANAAAPNNSAAKPSTPPPVVAEETAAPDDPDVPLYFYAPAAGAANLAALTAEREFAVSAGITKWIVPVPLPWPGHEDAVNTTLTTLKEVADQFPNVRVLLHVNLNPPAEWLAAHPDAQVLSNGELQPYAAPDSQIFRSEAQAALGSLLATIRDADENGQLMGYIISALHNGHWYFNGDGDRSPAAGAAFRQWLTDRHGSDERLQKAWGREDITLAEAAIPFPWDDRATTNVFFDLTENADRSDYLRFQSERIADAIGVFARFTKDSAGDGTSVYVPYGFTFELPALTAGHCALETVLASPIDGIVQPVSLATRVIGATGGYMGPVNTGVNSRKKWLILDDTRTGIATAMQETANDAVPAVRLDSIYNVQRRNFASALSNGLELAWCDWSGQGQLRDETMWRNFAALRVVYRDALRADRANGGQYRIYDLRPEGRTSVMVVVDEESLYLQQAGNVVTDRLLRNVRDAALHAGTPAQFCLLSDVLADRAASADVYVFANAFALPESDRQRLHAILAREKAVAIWLYAPGYYDGAEMDEDHIAATTLMEVTALKDGGVSGSRFDLAGTMLQKDETYGDGSQWNPMFSIDSGEEISPIAYYTGNGDDRLSAAAYFSEDGWTSIYLAEPTLPDVLMRELLRILEVPSIFSPNKDTLADSAYFARELVAVHSREGGARALQFAWEYNVVDAAQSARAAITGAGQDGVTGWLGKRVIDLQLQSGETRILRVSPASGTSGAAGL